MTIGVTYPNEGLYADGKPRYEQRNKAWEITFCREATPQEAMFYGLIDALFSLSYQMQELQTELRNRQ